MLCASAPTKSGKQPLNGLFSFANNPVRSAKMNERVLHFPFAADYCIIYTMMLKNFFGAFRGHGYEAIVDLGTEVVKTAGFKSGPGPLSGLQYAKEYYTPRDVLWGGFAEVFDAQVIVAKTMRAACNGAYPKRVEVILGPLFVTPCVVRKKFVRQIPATPITQEEQDAFHLAFEEECFAVYSEGRYAGDGEGKPVFLENVFQEWRIDGYREENLIGQKGNVIEIATLRMYASDSNMQVLEKLFRGIPKEAIKFSYECAYGIDLVKSISPGHRTVLLIDIGGKITTFFLIQEGEIGGIHSFHTGGHDMTESLAREFGVGYFEAEKMKNDYEAGMLAMDVRAKLDELLRRAQDEFFIRLEGALSLWYGSPGFHLISDIFFIGGGVLGEDIIPFLRKRMNERKELPVLNDFKIEIIKPASFLGGSLLNKTSDIFAASQDVMCAFALAKRVKTAEKRRI